MKYRWYCETCQRPLQHDKGPDSKLQHEMNRHTVTAFIWPPIEANETEVTEA